MSSIGVRLPVVLDGSTGFGMITTITDMIKQNLMMLVLTNPGERIMEPEYGVGITQYLFQNFSDNVYSEIDNKIREQASIYMPTVSINEVSFYSLEPDSNKVSFRLTYSIPSIAVSDLIEITI